MVIRQSDHENVFLSGENALWNMVKLFRDTIMVSTMETPFSSATKS